MRIFCIFVFLSSQANILFSQGIIGNDQLPQLQWKSFKGGTFVDGEESDPKVLHLPLDLNGSKGLKLAIESHYDFYLFINGELVTKANSIVKINADSLAKIYSSGLLLSAYSSHGLADLNSKWITPMVDQYNPRREQTGFASFILGATILLLVFITALLRTNPQLTQDYLNIPRLFNLRDRDDGQSLRIASSVNLLFYFFCSALASLALCITAHSSNIAVSFLRELKTISASHAFYLWLLLSMLIFCLMLIKLLLSFILSNLFGWKDTSGFQFFNFIRMVILSLLIIAIVSVTSFSLGISLNYLTLLKLSCFMLAIGAIMIYMKLLARATFHFFHLFFYLCATEVLPLVILAKVLLF